MNKTKIKPETTHNLQLLKVENRMKVNNIRLEIKKMKGKDVYEK